MQQELYLRQGPKCYSLKQLKAAPVGSGAGSALAVASPPRCPGACPQGHPGKGKSPRCAVAELALSPRSQASRRRDALRALTESHPV